MIVPYGMKDVTNTKVPRETRDLMRAFNRRQRRLRVVVEQTFGLIKQWKLVGNTVFRADLELQACPPSLTIS